MLGFAISLFFLFILFFTSKTKFSNWIKITILLLSLFFILPNAVLLIFYVFSPFASMVDFVLVDDDSKKPVSNVNVIIIYQSIVYTVVSSSVVTNEVVVMRTGNDGRFTVPEKLKRMPSAVPPFYIDIFYRIKIIVFDDCHKFLDFNVNDKGTRSAMLIMKKIDNADDLVSNIYNISSILNTDNDKLKYVLKMYILSAIKYYEYYYYDESLEADSYRLLSILYNMLGEKNKSGYFMKKYFGY